jgi:hypothetical protein
MQEQRTTSQLPTVPRSIVRKAKHTTNTNTGSPQQWTTSAAVQQQQTTTTTTNQIEERTVMSNLSPNNSAKTMMTNVSRMVETLGTAVNTLAKESANMARETANTNDTIKQMMIQQTETMNACMMLMTRDEERRQEIPTRVIQQLSTPSSTITKSQYSQSQQSTSANKRKIDGITDDETTAISTVLNEPPTRDEDDIDAMLEE